MAGSFVFFWLAPGVVAGLVPYLLTRWHAGEAYFGLTATRYAGGLVAAAGLAVIVECFSRFALTGRGTPAPVLPTERLVVTGLYRYVRNPMYVGVVWVIAGQALLLARAGLVAYAGLVWLVFHAFVLAYEEPALARQFGAEYERYRRHVPRWMPRLTPWDAHEAT